jgi:hypothetical protein
VALQGTRCLVGADGFDSFDPSNFISSGGGAAFVFDFDGTTWLPTADIFPSQPRNNGAFGSAAGLDGGGNPVVGAQSMNQVFFYSETTGGGAWNFSASPVVAAPGVVSLADFGTAVSLDDNTLLIGAPESDDTSNTGTGEGAAYIFYRNQGGAEAWQLKRRMLGSSLGVNSGFGTSVSLKGDFAAVGAPTDNTSRGEVYVYYRHQGGQDVWGELKRLTGPANAVGDLFGRSVSLDANGTWLAVGAPGAGTLGGQTHVYFINTGGVNNFGLIQTIENPASGSFATPSGDNFGQAASLDWPRLLVGAPNAEGRDRFGAAVLDCGRGYVFEINTGGVNNWGLEAEIFVAGSLNQQGVAGALQGSSVSLDGEKAALGSPAEATDKGSVNLYERNTGGLNAWEFVRKITDPTGVAGDRFGESVSLSGSRLALGAPGSDFFDADAGQVLVFQQNLGGADQWKLEARLGQPNCLPGAALGKAVSLCGPDLAAGAPNLGTVGSASVWRREFAGFEPARTLSQSAGSFGNSLSLDHEFLAVGAFADDTIANNQGSAFIFRRNQGGVDNWGLVKKITSADGAADDRFGRAVSLSSGFLAVGAPVDDDRGVDSGSAYVFSRNQGGLENWGQIKKITAADGAAGDFFGASLATNGEVLAIGADGAGKGYIHERNQGGDNNWGLSKQVVGTISDFGASSAISGHLVAFSGSGAAGGGGGEVRLYSRNSGGAGNWGLLKTVLPPEDADEFGGSIALYGGTLAVGAYLADPSGTDAGAAFVFAQDLGGANNWGLVKKLAPSGIAPGSKFGFQVALERGVIAVLESPASSTRPTLVHLFARNDGGTDNWAEREILDSNDLGPNAVGSVTGLALSGGVLAASLADITPTVVLFELTSSEWESYLRNVFGNAIVDDPAKEATHWGDLADPDGDGLTNVEEGFFGRNPLVSDANLPLFQPTIVSSSVFALLWTQNAEPFGIHACPEWSTDLTNWFVSGEDPPGAATARTITVSQTGTLNGLPVFSAQVPRSGSSRLWLRLKLRRE